MPLGSTLVLPDSGLTLRGRVAIAPCSSRGVGEGGMEETIPGLRREVYVRADQEAVGYSVLGRNKCRAYYQRRMSIILRIAKLLMKGHWCFLILLSVSSRRGKNK